MGYLTMRRIVWRHTYTPSTLLYQDAKTGYLFGIKLTAHRFCGMHSNM